MTLPLLKNRWLWAVLVAIGLGVMGAWPACTSRETPGAARLDFVLKDVAGKDVPLSDFAGRPILVNFWATWCPPCKAEIPWFVEFAEKYKAQRLAVVGISVDDPAPDVQAFVAEYKVNYPMLLARGREEVMAAYDATMLIPVSWLIRRDGSVLAKAQGFHDRAWFESRLDELVKE